jgi:hypothetical protein
MTGRHTDTQTDGHRQTGDLISLLSFLKGRLKMGVVDTLRSLQHTYGRHKPAQINSSDF